MSCTKRALVVSIGFGCIAMMNAVLAAENRPAWLFVVGGIEKRTEYSTHKYQYYIHVAITPPQHVVVIFTRHFFVCCPEFSFCILASFLGNSGGLEDVENLLEKIDT